MTSDLPKLSFDEAIPVHFSVDAALLRELGDRLIGRPEIALSEVIKNAYDADATVCEITFGNDFIEIVDDGTGMSEAEFLRFWMRIGSTHKERQLASARFRRPLTGQKGIGRLSVQFLGQKLHLESRSDASSSSVITANVDWREAVGQEDLIDATAMVGLTRDVIRFANGSRHGTRVRIEDPRVDWGADTERLANLAKQIWTLQPPLPLLQGEASDGEDPGFRIVTKGLPDEVEREFKSQMQAVLDVWTARITGRIDKGRSRGQCRVVVEIRDPALVGDEGVVTFEQDFEIPRARLDQANFEIRAFDLKRRQRHGIPVQDARDYFEEFGGVHVIDSGFRLPYYGRKTTDWLELEADQARRKDLSKLLPAELNISGAMLDLPRTRQLYGEVRINTHRERRSATQEAECLKISPGRDRLVENESYVVLHEVVRKSIDFYATRRKLLKEREAARQVRLKGSAQDRIESLLGYVRSIRAALPPPVYAELEDRASAAEESVSASEELAQQQKTMLAALATAGMAALALDHELRRELGRLGSIVDSCSRQFADHPELAELLGRLSTWMVETEESWRVFSPLMTEEGRRDRKSFRVKAMLDIVVRSTRRFLEGIQIRRTELPEDLLLPRATHATWQAIFQNVLINAANAQIDSPDPLIDCRIRRRGKRGVILVIQDRGVGLGVPLRDAESLFEPFERRLKLSPDRKALGLGGAGLGLTIVRMLADSAGCKTYFGEPGEGFSTAFCLEWNSNEHE